MNIHYKFEKIAGRVQYSTPHIPTIPGMTSSREKSHFHQ